MIMTAKLLSREGVLSKSRRHAKPRNSPNPTRKLATLYNRNAFGSRSSNKLATEVCNSSLPRPPVSASPLSLERVRRADPLLNHILTPSDSLSVPRTCCWMHESIVARMEERRAAMMNALAVQLTLDSAWIWRVVDDSCATIADFEPLLISHHGHKRSSRMRMELRVWNNHGGQGKALNGVALLTSVIVGIVQIRSRPVKKRG